MHSKHGAFARVIRRWLSTARRSLVRLVHQNASPAHLARGVAAGCFAAAFPIPGTQVPFSLLFAWIARGNKAVALLPQLASNALTMGPQAFLQFKIGAWLWPGQAAEADHAFAAVQTILGNWRWDAMGESIVSILRSLGSLGLDILGPLTLGVLVTGGAAILVSYPATVILVWTWQAWRRSRRLRKSAGRVQIRPLVLPPPTESTPAPSHLLTQYGHKPSHFSQAQHVDLLVNGSEAFPNMLAGIDSAQATVYMETYIFRADAVGERFHAALQQAARRGVRVRLIYDYIGSLSLPDSFIRALIDAGVEASIYNPLILTRPLWAANRRDHRKLLIVDSLTVFTGGLNIAADYDSAESGGGGWRDTHIRIDSAGAAHEAIRLFDQAWRAAIPYTQGITRADLLRLRARRRIQALARLRRPDDEDPIPDSPAAPDGNIPVQIIGNRVLRHRWRIHRAYLRAISRARRYILIENAYFIPNRQVRRALIRAVRRGVVVAVAVAQQNDVTLAAYASRNLYSELLAGGVRIFEWPHGMLHAKTAVIDDAWSIVGSYNFDHRSIFHQLEAVAVVVDADLGARLRDQTLADMHQCHEVTLPEHESRSWRGMLIEAVAFALRYWL